MEDADLIDHNPLRPVATAWGHCQRFPKWERKEPTTPACGEHPQYFLLGSFVEREDARIYGEMLREFALKNPPTGEIIPGWIDKRTGTRITTIDGLLLAQETGIAKFCKPGEVVPIDGPIE